MADENTRKFPRSEAECAAIYAQAGTELHKAIVQFMKTTTNMGDVACNMIAKSVIVDMSARSSATCGALGIDSVYGPDSVPGKDVQSTPDALAELSAAMDSAFGTGARSSGVS